MADQRTDCDQGAPCRNEQRDESQRFPKRKTKDDGDRPTSIVVDELDEVVGNRLEVHRAERCNRCLARQDQAERHQWLARRRSSRQCTKSATQAHPPERDVRSQPAPLSTAALPKTDRKSTRLNSSHLG